MPSKKELITIFVLYLALRLPWIFMVPMVEAPDEFSHFWVLRFLVDHLCLPNLQDVADGDASAVYGTLPQMGYIPHVLCVFALPFFDITIACRFGSLLMGLPMTWAAYKIGYELFPGSRVFALSVPLVVLFHPQMVLVNAYANNDSTAAALASLIILALIKMIKNGLSLRHSAAIGAMAGWLALSKYSGLAVFPALALGLIFAAWIHSSSFGFLLGCAAVIGGVMALESGWWFYNSWKTLDGDVLGTKTMRFIWANIYHKDLNYYESPWKVIKQVRWWRSTIYSYWAMFGYMTREIPKPLYFVYLGFMLTALVGGINDLLKFIKAKLSKVSQKTEVGNRQNLVMPAVWLTVSSCLFVNLAAMVWASSVNLGGAQGRYLMPSEIPIAALIAGGLFRCCHRYRDRLVIAFVVFNAIVYVYSVCMLMLVYGFRLKTY